MTHRTVKHCIVVMCSRHPTVQLYRDISIPLSEIYSAYHVTDSTRIRPPAGFCHCWSVRLEQSSGPCPQSEHRRSCSQALAKDIFVPTAL